MDRYIFVFDLDATITKVEIMPEIAAKINKEQEMSALTERTMKGEIPFDHSLLERMKLLSGVSVSAVREIIDGVPLNQEIVNFIRENRERCYVVSDNPDVWIEDLMKKIEMDGHYFCSKATADNDRIISIDHVVDKGEVVASFDGRRVVAIGNGNNDAQMIAAAEIGIGFGGAGSIVSPVLESATHATYSEDRLCQFLRQL